MAVERHRVVGGALCLLFVALVGGYFWLNQGYGEVSETTYEYSKALYSACLSRNGEHLTKIEQMIDSTDGEISTRERSWLKRIIENARDDHWQSAAKSAKRIMTDQVRYE